MNCWLGCLPGQAPTAAEVYLVLSRFWTRASGRWLMSEPSHWMTSLGVPACPWDIVQVNPAQHTLVADVDRKMLIKDQEVFPEGHRNNSSAEPLSDSELRLSSLSALHWQEAKRIDLVS